MSYYYGYYGYGAYDSYGADATADEPAPADDAPAYDAYYDEAPATDMEEDDGKDGKMMMAKMAWGLAIVADFGAYYVTNDKWSSQNISNWTNAANSFLGLGSFRAVTMAAGMAVPAIHDMFMPIA